MSHVLCAYKSLTNWSPLLVIMPSLTTCFSGPIKGEQDADPRGMSYFLKLGPTGSAVGMKILYVAAGAIMLLELWM